MNTQQPSRHHWAPAVASRVAAPALRLLVVSSALAVVLAPGTAGASASTAPYSVSDIGAAPASGFKISDVGPAPTPADTLSGTSAGPAAGFKISDVGPG